MPAYHPGDDQLLAYAAGSIEEPVALLIATHLALCPACRAEVARLEALGGGLLEDLEAEPLGEDSENRLLARLDELPPGHALPPRPLSVGETGLPRPLRDYIGDRPESLPWQSYRGLKKAELLDDYPGYRTRLMLIKAGTAMPWHSHEGNELTLVLVGGFSDGEKHFLPGDVALADRSTTHRPVADPGEDCLCLAVTDAPLRLTGPFGRLLNPFIRI